MRGRSGPGALCALIAVTAAALSLAGASAAAAPSNDSFSAAEVLLPATGSRNGTNVDATKEAGEPSHAGSIGGSSVWYKWVAPYTGNATFDTVGSGLDTLLAVYTGSSVNALTLVAQNDDFLGWKWTSKLGFAAIAGTTYYIAVDGYNDGSSGPAHGTFAVNWDLQGTPAVVQPNDNFAAAVQIDGPGGSTSGSNFGATEEAGEPNHAGNDGGHSVWFRWAAPYDGTFTFSTDASQFNTLLAVYSGVDVGSLVQVAANDDIAWNNLRSMITFTASAGTVYSIALDGKKFSYSGAASGNYVLAWSSPTGAPGAPANDFFGNPQTLPGASGAVSGSSVGATKETGEPLHTGNAGGASVWYSWTAPASGNVDLSTAGSGFDTLLAAYTGSAVNGLTQVAANDDVGPGKGPSDVVFAATAGTTYRIAVDGYLAPGATFAPRGPLVLSWSMQGAAAPANDDLDSAITITGTGGVVNRSTLGATKETGEPDHAGNPGGASVWFRWHALADGQWRFYTTGSSFNTVLGVYTGDTVDNLTLVGSNDDVSSTDRTSSVTVTVRSDVEYWIALDGYRGANGPAASGNYTFLWELLGPDPTRPANDDFASAWTLTGPNGHVTGNNSLATKESHEPDHADNRGGASIWFQWTAPSSGPVSFDTPGSSFDTLLAVYTGTGYSDLQELVADDDIAFNHWWPDGRYQQSYVSFVAQQGQTYYLAVDGKSGPGKSPGRGSVLLGWWLSPPPGDVTMLAAGDISRCDASNDEATASILGQYPDATVAPLGDVAYENGTDAELGCYDQSWGVAKDRTRPVPGNHDYGTPGAAPYFSYFGSQAGAPSAGYYSYELGGWHVVALNSECDQVGGCDAGSPEEQWLRNDLRANRNTCTIAYLHDALFASSGRSDAELAAFWQALYDSGVDVIVSGDSHYYERFAPQTPSGALDLATGIRELIVGTGGATLAATPASRLANSEVLDANTYGVLRLTLKTAGYDWQFIPAAGGTFTDSGQGTCTGAPSVFGAAPGAPVSSSVLSSDGKFSLTWTESPDLGPEGSYTLQQKGNGAGDFSDVAAGLNTHYNFTPAPEAEGTYVFRVQGTDGRLTSAYSAPSAPVVVDKTAPLPPSIQPDRPADYTGTGGGWWKDRVAITFTSNGDPALADGSPGSGVDPASIPGPITTAANAAYTVSATAQDRAGNRSLPVSLKVQVDATPPALSLTCPKTPVLVGTAANAGFTASDGGSGLASPSSGNVLLDTRTPGTRIANVTATDRVGHQQSASCSFTVQWTPPVFAGVTDLNVPATSTAGAVVTYPLTARDATGALVPVVCVPPSGSVFATDLAPFTRKKVTCTATDSRGASTQTSFYVHVAGMIEQLGNLVQDVQAMQLDPVFLRDLQSRFGDILNDLYDGKKDKDTCKKLDDLVKRINDEAKKPGGKITVARAAQLTTFLARFKGYIGC